MDLRQLQYWSALMQPRTHQAWKVMDLNAWVILPVSKKTSYALFGLPASVVVDLYASVFTLVKGWPRGRVDPAVMEGSTRLASSEIDGSLQPFRPPTSLSAQAARASVQDSSVVSKVFSYTSPVSSSRTAASPKDLKTVNLDARDTLMLQFRQTR